MNQYPIQSSADMRAIEMVVSRIFSSAPILSGYGEIVSLPSAYAHRICFTSILITVKALASALQRHPPDRFTQHQLNTLRHDLAALF